MLELQPGANNDVTDVEGVCVGHHSLTADGALTGVTVVVPPPGSCGGVDVRGAAPGTRETDLLDSLNSVTTVDAVVLSGGSAYGLSAAGGVMEALEREGRGWPVPGGVVPIVPAAVIFDLGRGDFALRPGPSHGFSAFAERSTEPVALGSVGAGTGAVAGGLRGGVGSASAVLPSGATVAALVVVNSAGSVVDPRSGALLAARLGSAADSLPGWAVERDRLDAYLELLREQRAALETGTATTIGVVVTDYALTKAQCARLAGIGHDGLARAIDPVHTMVDGDTLFGLATGTRGAPSPAEAFDLLEVAAGCVSRAVGRAIAAAAPGGPAPTYTEMLGPAAGG